MKNHTKDTIIDYLASLGEYAAEQSIEINNIHSSLSGKMNHLEKDVVLNGLQQAEKGVHKQLSEVEKSISQIVNDTHTTLSSAEENILKKATLQMEELKEMRIQLFKLIEKVELKTAGLVIKCQDEMIRKIDRNQNELMARLEQDRNLTQQEFNELNQYIETLNKKIKYGNVVSTLTLGVLIGLIVYLSSIGVILR